MSDDELRLRLRAADPVTPSPADSWIDDLVEATMNTPTDNETRGRSWLLPVAAAAAAAALGVGAFAVLDDSGGSGDADTAAEPTSISLALPDSGPAMGMCMAFDPALLSDMDLALSGTVTATDDDSVTLDVDRWYRGGDADKVELEHTGAATQVALDGIAFEDGARYLVTATDGTVVTCGYSQPWSEELAAQFAQAFGS